jgi:hypothetical protein
MTTQEKKLKSAAKIHTVYKTADGTRVPAVSTILGELAKPALIEWAWRLGTQGINYREYRDALADVGTLTHRMILDHLKGEETDFSGYNPDTVKLAGNCFGSFKAWEATNKIEPVILETPLVSELFRYGGTADFLGYVNGKLTLVDFKTGGIYPEHFMQLSAYSALVNEHRSALGPIEQYLILGIPRAESETFLMKSKSSLNAEWGIFQAALKIYTLKKDISK